MASRKVFVVGVGMTKVCTVDIYIGILPILISTSLKNLVEERTLIIQTWSENQVELNYLSSNNTMHILL